MGDEVNIAIEAVWGEVEMLNEVIARSFDKISDEDLNLLMIYIDTFIHSRGRAVERIC